MPIVPESKLGKIEFYEAHLAPFAANAAAIGLAPAAVTALSTATLAARAAYNAHQSALEASKAATQAFYDKVKAMHSGPGLGADMIQTIKTFAQTTNNPNVYVLAQLPAPAAPGTAPPPGTPFDFSIALLQTGAIELKWKCNNPEGTQGTIYEVRRKLNGPATDYQFVGATGIRTFVDDSLPLGGGAGGTPVIYQITAVRSTSRGNPANFLVSFGVGGAGSGGFTVTTLNGEHTGESVRIAA
jgi:hypothetical protein